MAGVGREGGLLWALTSTGEKGKRGRGSEVNPCA